MEIDYKKINEYSEVTRLKVIKLAKLFLSFIEIYKGIKIPLSDFEKSDFSYGEVESLTKIFNDIVGESITNIQIITTWSEGPINTRKPIKFVYFTYNKETISIVNSFLEFVVDKKGTKTKKISGNQIIKIDILINNEGAGKIKIYINGNYSTMMGFSSGRYWGMMYNLAENQSVPYNKGFFDYFNSNLNNPIYLNYEFALTKILKKEGDYILPNIKIKLITQKQATQQLKSA